MPSIESGSFGASGQVELSALQSPEQQAREKAREMVDRVENTSRKYLAKLDRVDQRNLLVAQGVDAAALSPKGEIYEDIHFPNYNRPQTEALVSWSLQHAIPKHDEVPAQETNPLHDAMEPIDDAFRLAKAYLRLYPKQHPELIALARLLGVPEELDSRYRRIAIRTSLSRLRGDLPLHRTEANVTSSLPPTEVILRALRTHSMRLYPADSTAQMTPTTDGPVVAPAAMLMAPIPEDLRDQRTREALADGSEASLSQEEMVGEVPITASATEREKDASLVRIQQEYLHSRWNNGKEWVFTTEIPREWGVSKKEKEQALKAVSSAIKESGFRMSREEAQGLYASMLTLAVLPRALRYGHVSPGRIGNLPPLQDGRRLQVIPHPYGRHGKKVWYQYDLVSDALSSPRGIQQRLADEKAARDYIYERFAIRSLVNRQPEDEFARFAERVRLAKGEVTPDEVFALNLDPTPDDRIVVVREVEGKTDEEKRYSYDLSLPRNEADTRTPKQRRNDRLRAIDMLEQALKKKREESSSETS